MKKRYSREGERERERESEGERERERDRERESRRGQSKTGQDMPFKGDLLLDSCCPSRFGLAFAYMRSCFDQLLYVSVHHLQ